MLIGSVAIGSRVLIDEQNDGRKFSTATVVGSLNNKALVIEFEGNSSLKDGKLVTVEITNAGDNHVYRYVRCRIYIGKEVTLYADGESFFQNTRQERRFAYHNQCFMFHNEHQILGSKFRDISLSGAAITVPKKYEPTLAIGDLVNIYFKHIGNESMAIVGTIMRVGELNEDYIVVGCHVEQGKEFTSKIISKVNKSA